MLRTAVPCNTFLERRQVVRLNLVAQHRSTIYLGTYKYRYARVMYGTAVQEY
jgi:hypothetical protein